MLMCKLKMLRLSPFWFVDIKVNAGGYHLAAIMGLC